MIKESHGAWRSNVLVLSDVGVGGTAPGDKSEHVAVVVPRKHLNKEVASEQVPVLVPEGCPEGSVSSRRNANQSASLGNDESGGR